MNLPADIELSFPLRELAVQLGRLKAIYVFHRLWVDLAIQARGHGRGGVYLEKDQPHFVDDILQVCGVPPGEAVHAMSVSNLIRVEENGDWFCQLFHQCNPHLDASYIPSAARWMDDWLKLQRKLKESADTLAAKIVPEAWHRAGAMIPSSTMNRAVMLIHTLDLIFTRKSRPPELLGVASLQLACDVVTKISPAKLSVVLKRLLALCRPRLNPQLPHTTEAALEHFDDVVFLALPDEGFEAWSKRIESPPYEELRPEGISTELIEHYRDLKRI